MKKLLIILLCLVFMFSAVACSANSSGPSKQESNETSNSKNVNADVSKPVAESGTYTYSKSEEGYILIDEVRNKSEKVTLRMAGWEGGPSETDNVNNALELFSKYYPNIKVEYTPSPDAEASHHGKIMTMYAAGTAPDVFYCGSANVEEFAAKGILYDITDIFFDIFTLDDYIPAALQCMQKNGRLYGITSCTVSPELYYNRDLFDEAGVEYPPTDPANPWTWDEFIAAAKALTKVDENGKVKQYGFYGLEDPQLLTAYFYQYDIDFINEDKTLFTATDDPNFKKILQNIKELRTVHKVTPQAKFTESVGMNNVQMLLTGTVAMFTEGSWGMEETAESGVNFGVSALPVMPGGHSASWGQAHIHSIISNTKHFDEAWALLCFLASDEYQLNLVREGLWMPNKTSCYTKESISSWLTENHPEGFAEHALYFKDYCKICPQTVFGSEAYDIFVEECERYFDGNEDLDAVITRMRERIDKVLQE